MPTYNRSTSPSYTYAFRPSTPTSPSTSYVYATSPYTTPTGLSSPKPQKHPTSLTMAPTQPSTLTTPTNTQLWTLYHFETHATTCPSCHHPYHVHRSGTGKLCRMGRHLAESCADILGNGAATRLALPENYVQVKSLVRAMQRSSRHPGQAPIVRLATMTETRRGERASEEDTAVVVAVPAQRTKSSSNISLSTAQSTRPKSASPSPSRSPKPRTRKSSSSPAPSTPPRTRTPRTPPPRKSSPSTSSPSTITSTTSTTSISTSTPPTPSTLPSPLKSILKTPSPPPRAPTPPPAFLDAESYPVVLGALATKTKGERKEKRRGSPAPASVVQVVDVDVVGEEVMEVMMQDGVVVVGGGHGYEGFSVEIREPPRRKLRGSRCVGRA